MLATSQITSKESKLNFKQIKHIMIDYDISSRKLAEYLGLAYETVSGVLNGSRKAGKHVEQKFQEFLSDESAWSKAGEL